jgi:hypothetical protein
MAAVKFNGSTSGYTQLQAAAVAGSNTLLLPTTGTTLLSDGNTLTFTQTQTFAGNTGALAFATNNIGEVVTINPASVTAPASTQNYDVTTQSIVYFTGAAANNWTVNFRGSSTTNLNAVMAVGQAVTCVNMVTCTGTGYYQTAITVDGTSFTPKWAGGTAPAIGFSNSINVYTYTLIKTANNVWTVLANQQKFA